MMRVLIAPTASGLWNICRSNTILFRDLPLAAAIKLARQLAREEHACSDRDIVVEMQCAGAPILLAHYARPQDTATPGFSEAASAA